MGIWYVKRMDSQDEIPLLKRMFFIPEIKQIQNYYKVILPVKNGKELNAKMQKKIGESISKKIYEKQNQNLVLANSLKLKTLKNTLYANNLNILDGRKLFKYLLPQVIKYIAKAKDIDSHEIEVSIMTNDNSENTMKLLIELAQDIKMLSIVTDDIDRYKAMEEYLLVNMGIVIRTTNNKKRGLLKSNLIINLDFPEDIVNSYSLPKNGIIVNMNEKIAIKSKKFNGINCNSYKIKLSDEEEKYFRENNIFEDFNENELFESTIFLKRTYEAIKNEINKRKIEYLIGNNGKISKEEYKKLE